MTRRQPRPAATVPVLDRIDFFDRQNPAWPDDQLQLLVCDWFSVILTGGNPILSRVC